jgi:hypothetical protein
MFVEVFISIDKRYPVLSVVDIDTSQMALHENPVPIRPEPFSREFMLDMAQDRAVWAFVQRDSGIVS